MTAGLSLKACAKEAEEKPNVIVIYTDDQGYADLGCQGSDVIKTPHVDQLAERGVRFTNGYVTAPQCMPSRAGLLTGKYQQTFGFYDNRTGPLPLNEKTLGNYFQQAGYRTGAVGKWHLQVGMEKRDRGVRHYHEGEKYQPGAKGFDEYFTRAHNPELSEQFYLANYDLQGNKLEANTVIETPLYRIEAQTKAALGFIQRNREQPFFLYLAYFAPHVPLDAPQEYLDRFPNIEHPRRKLCAAMLSAIDDGVGDIYKMLLNYGISENTIIVFMSDNGAPANLSDGSINDPLRGYKGSLFEGGIRVPLIISWPEKVAGNRVSNDPVMTLDISTTLAELALGKSQYQMDGQNLLPLLKEGKTLDERNLYWVWQEQSAIRCGKWKYLDHEGTEFLFNLDVDISEQNSVLKDYPKIAEELKNKLNNWKQQLPEPKQPREVL